MKRKRKYTSDSSGEDNHQRKLVAPKLHVRPSTTGKLDIPYEHVVTPTGLSWQPPSDDTDSDLSGPPRKGKKRERGPPGATMIKVVKRRPDDEDPVKYLHIKGGWRSKWNKAHPEFVPLNRMEMEKKWNPLIKLLGTLIISPHQHSKLIHNSRFAGIELRVENEHGENGMEDSDAASSSEEEKKRALSSASEAEESDGNGGIVKPKVERRDVKPSIKMRVSPRSPVSSLSSLTAFADRNGFRRRRFASREDGDRRKAQDTNHQVRSTQRARHGGRLRLSSETGHCDGTRRTGYGGRVHLRSTGRQEQTYDSQKGALTCSHRAGYGGRLSRSGRSLFVGQGEGEGTFSYTSDVCLAISPSFLVQKFYRQSHLRGLIDSQLTSFSDYRN